MSAIDHTIDMIWQWDNHIVAAMNAADWHATIDSLPADDGPAHCTNKGWIAFCEHLHQLYRRFACELLDERQRGEIDQRRSHTQKWAYFVR